MIQAKFVLDQEKRIESFYLTGHAEYAESGKDIYCSAVSAITQTVIGTLTEIIEAGRDFVYLNQTGVIECRILNYNNLSQDKKIAAQSLMLSAYIGLKQIEMIDGQEYLSIEKVEEY
ncbi:MAG TPA: ribosomal-processing cysteine protease Prp [Clostridiaceae bacterium]|nr:ribosomal-processing cysteine protease Prp [Clostridiaceae bacterium]